MSLVRTYDPAQVVCTFLGVPLSGFADGTFIKVAFDEDSYSKQVGADGEAARARNQNLGGSIALTLQQSSASNDILSANWAADRAGLGAGPFMVKDLNGTTLAVAPVAWIKKLPDAEFGKELGSREWTFDTGRLVEVVGGNL
jgi:hypothetical protein